MKMKMGKVNLSQNKFRRSIINSKTYTAPVTLTALRYLRKVISSGSRKSSARPTPAEVRVRDWE